LVAIVFLAIPYYIKLLFRIIGGSIVGGVPSTVKFPLFNLSTPIVPEYCILVLNGALLQSNFLSFFK
jgi:hypothetical protein